MAAPYRTWRCTGRSAAGGCAFLRHPALRQPTQVLTRIKLSSRIHGVASEGSVWPWAQMYRIANDPVPPDRRMFATTTVMPTIGMHPTLEESPMLQAVTWDQVELEG